MFTIRESRKLWTKCYILRKSLVTTTTRTTTSRCRLDHIYSKFYRINNRQIFSLFERQLVAPIGVEVLQNGSFRRHNHSSAKMKTMQIILPDIGEGISEVVIQNWQVKVGDSVKNFDAVCEVESDKATATITSRFDGVVKKIYYQPGDTAKVGKPLADIEMISNDCSDHQEVAKVTEAVGNNSNQEQKQVVETSQSSDKPFRLSEIITPPPSSSPTASSTKHQQQVTALPSVRRLAKENGVDLSKVRPTGKHGHFLKEDLLAYISQQQQQQQDPGSSSSSKQVESETRRAEEQQVNSNKKLKEEIIVPLRGIQKAMFKTMTQSLKIPHFSYSDEINLTSLVKAAGRRKELLAKNLLQQQQQQQVGSGDDKIHSDNNNNDESKVNNFAFIVKMVSLALLEYPQLNSSLDDSCENLIEKRYHNIGIAVDTPAGLVVPNIKNVETKSIVEINSELTRLRQLGYKSKLNFNDLSGATITLSNIGAIGGIFGVPVIVAPEIVIGALGRIRKLPRFNSNGAIEECHMMQIVWSADHRVVDGATLSRFSNLLKHYLEEPEFALLKLT